jgi:hypothetical protein
MKPILSWDLITHFENDTKCKSSFLSVSYTSLTALS